MRLDVPVDVARAQQQWQTVVDAFAHSGLTVHQVAPLATCEDMVFTANPSFTGIDARGVRRCVASRMRFESRQPEVLPQIESLHRLGYTSAPALADSVAFEGGGDAVWDFERRTIYLGIGPRTDSAAAAYLEKIYGAQVIPLKLKTERFYHLDTALAVLDDEVCILYPGAFDDASCAVLSERFPNAIEVGEDEANRMACNAARAGGNAVLIDEQCVATIRELRKRGYDVAALDTSEFMKSGGSVYCMKQYVY